MVIRLLYVALILAVVGVTQLSAQVQKVTKYYRTAVNHDGTSVDLFMDIYWDESVFSTERCSNSEPFHEVIMFMHGGFFLGGDRKEFSRHCISLAEQGFVAATIDYRVGGYNSQICTQDNSESTIRAVYRAMQDAHSAMSYLKMNLRRIVQGRTNTDKMYVGGYSAGAITALNLAFLDQQEVDGDYPYLTRSLGPIVESGINRIYPSIVVSIGGAICGDLSYIRNNSRSTFVLAFAGSNDDIVPYQSGNFQNCATNPAMYGAGGFANHLEGAFYCFRTITQPGGGHGSFAGDASRPYVVSEIKAFVSALRRSLWGCEATVRFPFSSNYIYRTGSECFNSYYGKIAINTDDYEPIIETTGSISYSILNQNMEKQPTLSLNLSGRTDVSVKMYTLDGSLVKTIAECSLGSGNYEYAIPNVASGVYMIRICGGEYIRCEKLIIH
jgi:poly(3-hydroxybutyrate) depolymerase